MTDTQQPAAEEREFILGDSPQGTDAWERTP